MFYRWLSYLIDVVLSFFLNALFWSQILCLYKYLSFLSKYFKLYIVY